MPIKKRQKLVASILMIVLLVVFAALIVQMARIQIIDHDWYQKKATLQHLTKVNVPARRGPILDRNGIKLADSLRCSSVVADPQLVEDKVVVAQQLSEILNLEKSEILKLLNKDKRFVWIKRKIAGVEEVNINRLNIKGIYTDNEYKRLYPNNELASHILGITDIDGNGLEGVEYKFDRFLQGTDGHFVCERDGQRRHINNINNREVAPQHGNGVVLTIDSVIQKAVEDAIDEAYYKWKAKSVVAIVMAIKTGEILAMANRPTFNPNIFQEYPKPNRKNRAITDSYEPGSIIKPIIVGALFEKNLASPDEEIFCHNGAYRIGSRTLHDAHGMDNLSVADIVAKSSNIGMAKLGERLGNEGLYNCLANVGFGAKLNIGLPGEASGMLRPVSLWTDYSLPSITMGHEFSVTPLQFITAFSTIANGGKLIRPFIVSAIITNDLKQVKRRVAYPTVVKDVMTAQVARKMLNPILVRVVEGGTGKKARIEEYSVAGKTGTAQKLDENGYSHTKFISSFVAYAPADNPKVCVLVMVDEPVKDEQNEGVLYGGTVAAPVVKDIIKKTLDHQKTVPFNSFHKTVSLLKRGYE